LIFLALRIIIDTNIMEDKGKIGIVLLQVLF